MHPREGWPKDGSRPPLFSRRSFLTRSAGAGLAALGGGALLDACAPGLAGTGSVPLPRPNNPVTWSDLPGQQADRQRSAAGTRGHPPDLQLGRLRQPGLPESLRQEVQLQGPGDHVQHDERGHVQAAQRPVLRRVHGRDRGRARPAHRVQAGPAAEPQLHPEHQPRPGRTSPTRSTTGAGSTPSRTRSTPPAYRGAKTWWTRIRTRCATRGRCPGSPSTRARWPSWTTTGRASASG